MKHGLLFLLNLFLLLPAGATRIFHFDRMTMATSGMDEGQNHSLCIDQNGNKYISNLFKNTITFGSHVLPAPANSTVLYSSWGIYLAKFGPTDTCENAVVLAAGDSIRATAMKQSGQHLFVAVTYNGTLYFGADSLRSKGKSDVALLKFNLNLQLVDKLNIGGASDESMQHQGFDLYNGQLYLGCSVHASDMTVAFDHYQLVLGPDTLHFDYDSLHTRGDYVITRLDTALQPLYSRSMGGQYNNSCLALRVGPQGIYVLGSTHSSLGNEAGGLLFNYAQATGMRYFIARLDEQFSGLWVRRIAQTGFGDLFLKKMELAGDRIIFSGSTTQSSGCGPSDFVHLVMDYGPVVGDGAFIYSCAYDTAGVYRWHWVNPIYDGGIQAFYYSPHHGQLFFAKTVLQNEVLGGDTLQPCSGNDLAIGTVDAVTGQRKMVANLCSNGGSYQEKMLLFAEDAGHKLYVLGLTNAGMVELPHTTVYPNQGMQNLFYLSLDSIDVYPLQVSAQERGQQLRLFPNPAQDEVVLDIPSAAGTCSVLITDATGKKIYFNEDVDGPKHRISIGSFPRGIYVVQLRTESKNFFARLLVQ